MNKFLGGHLSYHGLLCHKKFGDGDVVLYALHPKNVAKNAKKGIFCSFLMPTFLETVKSKNFGWLCCRDIFHTFLRQFWSDFIHSNKTSPF